MKFVDFDLIKKIDFKDPAVWLASWFGCGFIRPAPGTWGTFGGLPFGIVILLFGGWPSLFIAMVLVTLIGWWAAERFEKMVGDHDNSTIVIDEVAGLWIALLPAGTSSFYIFLGFLLFRFFDILKPWPISWCDKKIPGGLGVMVDDLVAGLFAAIVIIGMRYAGLG